MFSLRLFKGRLDADFINTNAYQLNLSIIDQFYLNLGLELCLMWQASCLNEHHIICCNGRDDYWQPILHIIFNVDKQF